MTDTPELVIRDAPVARFDAMLAEAHASNRVVRQWRISPDMWTALMPVLFVDDQEIGAVTEWRFTLNGVRLIHGEGDWILGLPVITDTGLPPRSIMLEG